MSRLGEVFAAIRESPDPGLITFVTAGDPDRDRSAEILQVLDRSGADVIEVGVPFSDPLADGPVIQRACERALKSGTTLRSVLQMVSVLRGSINAGIVQCIR